MTYSHSNSVSVNVGGQREKVFNPSLPTSDKSAFYYSPVYSARVELKPTNETPTIVLPAGVTILSVSVIVTTLFTTGAKVEIGSAAAGTDVLAATAIDAAVASPLTPKVASVAGNELFVTVTGAPTVGDAILSVQYAH